MTGTPAGSTGTSAVSEMTMWIDGAAAVAGSGRWIEVVDPATSLPIARVPEGTPDDVDRAVRAARRAFAGSGWSRALPAERAAVLLRIADLMEAHGAELAELEARNTGKTLRMARDFDLAGSIDNVRFFAGAARNLEGKAAGEYMPARHLQDCCTTPGRRCPRGGVAPGGGVARCSPGERRASAGHGPGWSAAP